MTFSQKLNKTWIRKLFHCTAALSGALFLASCSDNKLPSPPKAHPELLLEIYDATSKGEHQLALKKIERLRTIEKTSVFLSELESVERNNAVMEQVNQYVETGNFAEALKYLEAQEIRNGTHDDTTEAKEQIRMLAEIDTLLNKAQTARSSDALAKTVEDLRKTAKKIMISQKIQNFIDRKESEIRTMQTVEKDRMQFGMIADIGAMLEQGNAEAAVIAAVLALEDEENPVLPKILSVMSGAQGRDK